MIVGTDPVSCSVAGTHTTSATTTLLFYHLLHNPAVLQQCVDELDAMLPGLEPEQTSYPISLLEASLPFTRNCIKENFRLTPVFTMPLARHVTQPEGVTIAGRYLPQGVRLFLSLSVVPGVLPTALPDRLNPSRGTY